MPWTPCFGIPFLMNFLSLSTRSRARSRVLSPPLLSVSLSLSVSVFSHTHTHSPPGPPYIPFLCLLCLPLDLSAKTGILLTCSSPSVPNWNQQIYLPLSPGLSLVHRPQAFVFTLCLHLCRLCSQEADQPPPPPLPTPPHFGLNMSVGMPLWFSLHVSLCVSALKFFPRCVSEMTHSEQQKGVKSTTKLLTVSLKPYSLNKRTVNTKRNDTDCTCSTEEQERHT
jgi:hypothetical protein